MLLQLKNVILFFFCKCHLQIDAAETRMKTVGIQHVLRKKKYHIFLIVAQIEVYRVPL